MPSWEAWARSVPDLPQRERHILIELSTLVDSRGVTKAAFSYLRNHVGISRSTLYRGLAGLEERGLIQRRQGRTENGTWNAGRIQLIRTPHCNPQTDTECAPQELVAELPTVPRDFLLTDLDDDALKALIREAANNHWHGQAANTLAAIIRIDGPKRFGRIIRNRRAFHEADDPWDTLTLAWTVLQRSAPQLLDAERVWGLWTAILASTAHAEDAPKREDKENGTYLSDAIDNEARTIETLAGESIIGVDDIADLELVRTFVKALVEAGMPEAIAWAGTAIVAGRMDSSRSDRHRLVGLDARLHTLGITPEAARSWMSALVGTRRGKPGIAHLPPEEIAQWAKRIVQATPLAA